MRYEIDVHAATPSYLQLAAKIRDDIAAGVYAPREPIRSLTQLSQETGLAIKTVQHALQVLKDEGLIYSVTGRGTFVSPREEG